MQWNFYGIELMKCT